MIADLHNHTPLCNHASGEMSQYIEQAIANNTQYFGFSDHAPMDFDKKYRMSFEDMKQYETNVLDMKKKYSDKIEILLGYEVDYLKGYMDDRVLNADVDYLIGSVHFLNKWGFDNPEFIGKYDELNIDDIWEEYFFTITEMAESGHFDIVGHLDLIKVFNFMPNKNILNIVKPTLQAIKKADITLEINMAGYRKPVKQPYPAPEILKEAFKLNIPITFGSDAHEPKQVSLYANEVVKLAKDIGYKECAVFSKKVRKMIPFS